MHLPAPGPLDPYADYRSGSTEPWTVDLLCAIIRSMDAHVVIETGTYLGRTTLRLFEVMRTLPHPSFLMTIESNPKNFDQATQYLADAIKMSGQIAFDLVQAEALTVLRDLPTGESDLIFLDDDHALHHVELEAREAMRLLRPRGVLAFHDVYGPFSLRRVVKNLGGIALDLPRLHAGGGLGLVVKED